MGKIKQWEDKYKFLEIDSEITTKDVSKLNEWYLVESIKENHYVVKGYTKSLMNDLKDKIFDEYIQAHQNFYIYDIFEVRSLHYPNYDVPFVKILKRSCRSVCVIKICNLLADKENSFFSIFNYVKVLNYVKGLKLEFKGISDKETHKTLEILRNKAYAHSDSNYIIEIEIRSIQNALEEIKTELEKIYSASSIYPKAFHKQLELHQFNGIDFLKSLVDKE